MSGEKDTIVNLRQSEYNRMMRSCRRMDNVESNIRSNVNQMAGRLQRDFESRMKSVNQRHDKLERGISRMSKEMRQMEAQTHQRLREQARQFQKGLEGVNQRLDSQRREYTRMIQDQEKRFSQALAQQRQELESRIQAVHDAMIQKEMNEKEQASQWINDTQTFLETIANEYRHEKFKPGALEKIRAELALAQGNFQNANYQAATATTQQTYIRASELRMELEQLEMEWEAYLEAARQSAAEVLAACDAQTVCQFTFETDAGAQAVDGQVDYWTSGGLSDLRNRAEAEINRLQAPDDLSLDDLKQSIAQSEQWRQESLELAEQAKAALIASQLRNNIGQIIEDALTDQGWEIEDAAYEGEDFRGAVHVKLKHLSGDEIVTIVTPETGPDQTISNKLNVSFFDRNTNDEEFRLTRLRAINEVLKEEGLEVGKPVCRPGTENQPSQDESKLDFEQVRTAKPKAVK